MQRLKLFITSGAMFILPVVAGAQGILTGGDGGEGRTALEGIVDFINNTIIPFILAIGFLVFVWGMFQFFILGGANDDAKGKGKSLMIYAISGFLLILLFWGIINLLVDFLGLGGDSLDNNQIPKTPQL